MMGNQAGGKEKKKKILIESFEEFLHMGWRLNAQVWAECTATGGRVKLLD